MGTALPSMNFSTWHLSGIQLKVPFYLREIFNLEERCTSVRCLLSLTELEQLHTCGAEQWYPYALHSCWKAKVDRRGLQLPLTFVAVDVEYSLQKPDLGLQMFPCMLTILPCNCYIPRGIAGSCSHRTVYGNTTFTQVGLSGVWQQTTSSLMLEIVKSLP